MIQNIHDEIIKPLNDVRIYDAEILPNKIRASYCCDKLSDRTVVNVAVKAGTLLNPKDFQGLAHFLEHMLFLGSKKYPDSDYYNKVVKKYGGISNAYTGLFETVYFFSVYNNGLQDVLDVFSRFFIDPLFDKKLIDREINAINNEHQKNINNQGWRNFQLMHNLSNKDNIYNTFGTGSFEVLNKPGLYEAMKNFWNKYYISDNLSISIVSKLSIKKQKEFIYKTFGTITPKENPNLVLNKPLYSINNRTVQIIPNINIKMLKYIWEIPSYKIMSNNMINDYSIYGCLSSIISSGQKGSLSNHLKKEGLISGLNCNIVNEGVFTLSLSLTDYGYKNINIIDGKIKYTIDYIFNKYDWSYIIPYYKKITKFNFDYLEKIDNEALGEMMALNYHYYPKKEILIGQDTNYKLNLGDVENIKFHFNKCFKILVSDRQIQNPITDPNYGFEYGFIENIDNPMIKYDLEIDITNDFINTQPKFLNNLGCKEKPFIIKDKIWFGDCDKFNEPYIEVGLMFGNEKFYKSVRNYLLTIIVISCLNFHLYENIYNISKLYYSIGINSQTTNNSILIYIRTLNDPVLFNKFISMCLSLINNIELSDEIIKSKIEDIIKSYNNVEKDTPLNYLSYFLESKIKSTEYSFVEILNDIKNITVDEVKRYAKSFLNDSSLKILYYGNLKIDYIQPLQILNKYLYNNEIAQATITLPKTLKLKHPNKNENNNAVILYYPYGNFNPFTEVCSLLTLLILEQPFFDELRTNKQLGYIVSMSKTVLKDQYIITQKIQSNKTCNEIISYIDEFNESINKIIEKCNLNEWKLTAYNILKEDPTSNNEYFNKIISEILNRTYLFTRDKLLIQQLEKITKNDILNFVSKTININNRLIYTINGN